jgi:uncharacterized protein (TIGR00288 family)
MEWLRRLLGRDSSTQTNRESTPSGDNERKISGADADADPERAGTAVGVNDTRGSSRAPSAGDGGGADERVSDGDGSERAAEAEGATGTRRGGPHPPETVPQGVALFVDGPNVLREEFDVDLDDVRNAAADAGPLITARLYLDEHATSGLIQAAEARGFQVITTSGDVDVRLAVDVARYAAEGRASTITVASRDTDFKPAVEAANEYGLATVAIAPGSYGRSDALRNAVDRGITLDELE